jgi:hypothetical protein
VTHQRSDASDEGYCYWLTVPNVPTRSAVIAAATAPPVVVRVHSTSPALAHMVIVCSGHEPSHGARVANALNRAYGVRGAPVYDEDTGEPTGAA